VYRAVILFFSGTGNTWWVADRIKKQLDQRGINADTVSVDTLTPAKADWWIRTADLVLLGWPVYGSDMPEPMKQFVDALPVVEKGKHIHVFCTQMIFSGDGAWHYHRHFEDKGLIIDSAEHFFMPSNLSGNKSEAHYHRVMECCGRRVDRYVERLMMSHSRIRGKHSGWMGILQRGPYRWFYGRMQRLIRIDADKCTGCGLCVKLCPVENIKLEGNAQPLDHCALCMRCAAFCPARAISVLNIRTPYALYDKRFRSGIFK